MGCQGQVDGCVEPCDHHRPDDAVDGLLIQLTECLGCVVGAGHGGVEFGDLLGGKVGHTHGELRLVGRRGSVPTVAPAHMVGQGTPTLTPGAISPEQRPAACPTSYCGKSSACHTSAPATPPMTGAMIGIQA